jgi:uroporphyrin-III C-methyltransferase/precorrin-2 dehydrogenase/sirohydrochlorin ferrochelatase
VYVGTVATLPQLVRDRDIKPPSMTIIGEVVRLHERLAWFGSEKLKVKS